MKSLGFFLALLGIGSAAFAATDAGKSRELQDVQAKIQRVGSDVKALAAEKAEYQEQLKKLEKQYGELINAVNGLKVQISQREQGLQEIRNKISATQKDLRIQQHGLEGLIKAVAAMGDEDNLKILLNPSEPALSSRMKVYFDYISKARLQKLKLIQQDVESLRQLEAQKDNETQLIQRALEKKQQETDDLQALKVQREKLLATINSNYASKQEQLEHLEHDAKKLESLLVSLQKTDDNAVRPVPDTSAVRPTQPAQVPAATESVVRRTEKPIVEPFHYQAFEDLKGQLPWPVHGSISERFGSKRYEMSWDGVVIDGNEGADVRAVAPGRVVYADWLRGYGLMVIVDHGKGYMSLYAFNQSLHKRLGDQIKTGDSLASVGRSGGRAQAALYFGIRSKGRPLNPEQWCRSR